MSLMIHRSSLLKRKPLAPLYVGSNWANGASTNQLNIPGPAASLPGDLLFFFGAMAAGSSRSITDAGGWSEEINMVGQGDQRRMFGFSKVATGTGTGNTGYIQFNGTGVPSAYMIAVRLNSATDWAGSATNYGGVTSGAFPNISPSWGTTKPTLWLAIIAGLTITAEPGALSGWTNSSVLGPAHTSGCPLRFAYLVDQTASKTPPTVGFPSSTNIVCATMAIPGKA